MRRADGLYFRHASTLRGQRRVVEVPLVDYFRRAPGMVVYRVVPGGETQAMRRLSTGANRSPMRT